MDYDALFKLSYGLYIIGSKSGEKQSGFIGNTVFQVTSDPVNVSMCSSKDNFTTDLIKESGYFSVSVLKQDIDRKTIGLFGYKSGKDVNKFENVEFVTGKTGVPIVTEGTIAWFECEVKMSMELPTHIMFIGSVINNKLIDDSGIPLTYSYYREVYRGKAPKNALTFVK